MSVTNQTTSQLTMNDSSDSNVLAGSEPHDPICVGRTTKTIEIDGYIIKASTDEDQHLTLTIDHVDGSEVNNLEVDVAISTEQWGDRFTTDKIEGSYEHDGIDDQKSLCVTCRSDLSIKESVVREYVSKENDGESVFAHGRYVDDCFVNDSFEGFGGDRYDLLDDSDKCGCCEAKL